MPNVYGSALPKNRKRLPLVATFNTEFIRHCFKDLVADSKHTVCYVGDYCNVLCVFFGSSCLIILRLDLSVLPTTSPIDHDGYNWQRLIASVLRFRHSELLPAASTAELMSLLPLST